MTYPLTSSTAKSLLPTWSRSQDKDRDPDNTLLRPRTHETTRSRWASDSSGPASTGSRKGSLVEAVEPSERIGLGSVQENENPSGEELEEVRRRRKRGEESLRSALSSIGTLATDITRRLDYTYYNLLERLSALTSTIASFRELAASASGLFNDYERESAGLDQEIRKQISDLNSFQPQTAKIEALEGRMAAGRQKAEALSSRLATMRGEVNAWEKREAEWQARVGRRLRVFWSVVATALVVVLVAVGLQRGVFRPDESAMQSMGSGSCPRATGSVYPSGLAHRHSTCRDIPTERDTAWTSPDRLRILDEL